MDNTKKGSKKARGLSYQIIACSQEKLHDDDNSLYQNYIKFKETTEKCIWISVFQFKTISAIIYIPMHLAHTAWISWDIHVLLIFNFAVGSMPESPGPVTF